VAVGLVDLLFALPPQLLLGRLVQESGTPVPLGLGVPVDLPNEWLADRDLHDLHVEEYDGESYGINVGAARVLTRGSSEVGLGDNADSAESLEAAAAGRGELTRVLGDVGLGDVPIPRNHRRWWQPSAMR